MPYMYRFAPNGRLRLGLALTFLGLLSSAAWCSAAWCQETDASAPTPPPSQENSHEQRVMSSSIQDPGSLFAADADLVLEYFREVLSSRGLVDLLSHWCEGDHGQLADRGETGEWYCSSMANPRGFPGAGRSHARLMASPTDLFGLAMVLDDRDPVMSELAFDQLSRALEQRCACVYGENGVSYCHCADLEVRLFRSSNRFGLLAIDNIEQFHQHTGFGKEASPVAPRSEQLPERAGRPQR